MKHALNKRLGELKPRDKKTLASQRLLFKTIQLIWKSPKQVSAWREKKGKQCLVEVTTHFQGYLRHELCLSKGDGQYILEKLQRYCEEYNNHQFAAYALQGKIFSLIWSAKKRGM